MQYTYAFRLLASIALVVVVSACSDAPPFGGAPLATEGTIVSRNPWSSSPAFEVADDRAPASTAADYCQHVVIVTFDSALIVSLNGIPKDTSALAVGRRASVYTTGAMLKSCPPVVTAVGVLLR